jgi:hypothetical protein
MPRSADVGAVPTPLETEVLAPMAQGRTNRQIGAEPFISEKTAGVHRSDDPGQARRLRPHRGRGDRRRPRPARLTTRHSMVRRRSRRARRTSTDAEADGGPGTD